MVKLPDGLVTLVFGSPVRVCTVGINVPSTEVVDEIDATLVSICEDSPPPEIASLSPLEVLYPLAEARRAYSIIGLLPFISRVAFVTAGMVLVLVLNPTLFDPASVPTSLMAISYT